MSELKKSIQDVLSSFASGNLSDNAKALLNVLGYSSDRTFQLTPNTFEGLSEYFDTGRIDEKKIRKADWQSVDIIFQLTEDDIKKNHSLFEAKKVDNTIIESYLFFAVALTGGSYTRGDLVKITREINRLTPMPAMVFFRYGDCLTMAIIDRRLHKRESAKDVLEKVTLIKDINIAKPHRAHIEILDDLALATIIQKHAVANFVALHKAWQKTLDTSELNKRFYRELANWYFWAVQQVEFPADAGKNMDVRNATGVIRLLTRLIFIWFIKEKGLVPDDLFSKAKVKAIITDTSKDESAYYKAILQNLFFATLNTEMNKDKPGSRKFRGKRQEGRDQHYMIHNVFRYADLFTKPGEALIAYFENIPFLNGGLFECLDKTIKTDGKDSALRIDGFSERHDNALKVPDQLFFAAEQPVDLNGIYGTKNKTYKVKGLIDILDSYKFTIDENTPVEEEIALDPELLGKVFENLLASYNPETQTTARKQTGSFYTPREIVNYMVDESLIASLQGKVAMADGDARMRDLLSYTEEPHEFTDAEVDALIDAIDGLKILDPACGSGAFPMGILHKLAFILGKLDPHNDKWREKQRQKAIKETEEAYRIGEQDERQKRLLDIDDAFENNASDYGRKLYLIENCIFGVDIQPIAVQIAKLRFFISLIVDQQVNPDRANLGVRPLPNLETKFVAANTLIGIEKPAQLLLRNPEIDKKEKELKEVRERHFTARTPQTKEKYRKADERLRAEVSRLLELDGFPRTTTEQLAHWNPYDQNASAGFFDTEWMFGVNDGFDVVIGNPPYFNLSTANKELYRYLAENYKAIHTGYNDIVYYFIYLGLAFLNKSGCCVLITSNYYLGNEYARNLRKFLKSHIQKILNFKDHLVFDEASIHTCISISKKESMTPQVLFFEATTDEKITSSDIEANLRSFPIRRSDLNEDWVIADQSDSSIISKLNEGSILLGDISVIEQGSKSGKNNVFTISYELADKGKFEKELLRKNLKNGDIDRYTIRERGNFLIYVDNHTEINKFPMIYAYLESHKPTLKKRNEVVNGLYPWYRFDRPRNRSVFDAKEKIVVPYRAESNRFAYDNSQYFNDGGDIRAIVINDSKFDIKFVLALLNSRLLDWFYGFIGKPKGKAREYFNKPLSLIPIKKISVSDQRPFITLVDQILNVKKKDPSADTSALEAEIDKLVYQLYGLTKAEIALVEGKK